MLIEDVIYFINPTNTSDLKYLSLLKSHSNKSKEVQLNDINNYLLLLTLNYKISSALALGKIDKSSLTYLGAETNKSVTDKFFTLNISDRLVGNIVNYLGTTINNTPQEVQTGGGSSTSENIAFFRTQKISKYQRVKSKSQVFTGGF